jgi:hypothetical protein
MEAWRHSDKMRSTTAGYRAVKGYHSLSWETTTNKTAHYVFAPRNVAPSIFEPGILCVKTGRLPSLLLFRLLDPSQQHTKQQPPPTPSHFQPPQTKPGDRSLELSHSVPTKPSSLTTLPILCSFSQVCLPLPPTPVSDRLLLPTTQRRL